MRVGGQFGCKEIHTRRLHELPNGDLEVAKYFARQAAWVRNIRAVKDVVLVDVGGMVQTEKLPVTGECSHYICRRP
ncbi:MAG: hypothetical protein ACFBSC_12480 [Microcoleaceae cyanobacterium]